MDNLFDCLLMVLVIIVPVVVGFGILHSDEAAIVRRNTRRNYK